MKSETLNYGKKLLSILDGIGEEIPFKQLEKKCEIKNSELRELLKYLVKKEYISWRNPLFIGSINEINLIDTDKIKLVHKGMEVVLNQREYFGDTEKILQKIKNQTNIHKSPNSQVAQTTGDDSPIIQTQDNSQIIILKKIIEDDSELDDDKKNKLKEVVDKIQDLKSKGETVEKIYDLIKKGIGICARYGSYLIGLIS